MSSIRSIIRQCKVDHMTDEGDHMLDEVDHLTDEGDHMACTPLFENIVSWELFKVWEELKEIRYVLL